MTVEGTRQAMASQMLREMIAGANGRVSGELAEVYRQIADLLRWTGQAEAAMKYDLLHSECQLHDSRHRAARRPRAELAVSTVDK